MKHSADTPHSHSTEKIYLMVRNDGCYLDKGFKVQKPKYPSAIQSQMEHIAP